MEGVGERSGWRWMFVLAVLVGAQIGCGSAGEPRNRPRAVLGPATHLLSVEHRDHMSDTFELLRVRITVDGREVHAAGAEDAQAVLPEAGCVFRSAVPPGEHEVGVELLYRGAGHGVFGYLRDYRFSVRATTRVEMPRGAAVLQVIAAGVEAGGGTTPLEDRPRVRFTTHLSEADTDGGCFPGGARARLSAAPVALAERPAPWDRPWPAVRESYAAADHEPGEEISGRVVRAPTPHADRPQPGGPVAKTSPPPGCESR